MIFGNDKVIKASACFGKDATRRTQNLVWHLKFENRISPDKKSIRMDLERGQRLLNLIKKKEEPLTHRWDKTAYDEALAPRSGTINIDTCMNYGWGDVCSEIPDDDGPRAA